MVSLPGFAHGRETSEFNHAAARVSRRRPQSREPPRPWGPSVPPKGASAPVLGLFAGARSAERRRSFGSLFILMISSDGAVGSMRLFVGPCYARLRRQSPGAAAVLGMRPKPALPRSGRRAGLHRAPARFRPLWAGLCSRFAPLRPILCCAVPCVFGRPMAAKFLPPSLRTCSAEARSRTGVSCGVLSFLSLFPGGTSLVWAGSRIRPAGLMNLRNLTAVTLG